MLSGDESLLMARNRMITVPKCRSKIATQISVLQAGYTSQLLISISLILLYERTAGGILGRRDIINVQQNLKYFHEAWFFCVCIYKFIAS